MYRMEDNMNVKIINIILKILIVITLITLIKPNSTYAFSLTDILHSGQNFIDSAQEDIEIGGVNQGNVIDAEQLKKFSDAIYNISLGIGVILSVLVGAVLGIKIMWGSIEQQTKAKEALMPYAIGCVVIFGSFAIWKLAVTVFSQL